jgi:hypothetical protein
VGGNGTCIGIFGKDDNFWNMMPCSALFYPSFETLVPVCGMGRHIPEEQNLSVRNVETGLINEQKVLLWSSVYF